MVALLVLVGIVGAPAPAALAAVGTCTANSGAPAMVTFVNNSAQSVRVNWVGYDCAERTYATLPVGSSSVQSTYTGQPGDLMYAGPMPWRPALLDVGRDDYWTSSSPSCPGLLGSPFIA